MTYRYASIAACLVTFVAAGAQSQTCTPSCPSGYVCQDGACAAVCQGGCPEGRTCVAPDTCGWAPGAEAAESSAPSLPEISAAACRNGTDDDGDGMSDCADPTCARFLFCRAGTPLAEGATRVERDEPAAVEQPVGPAEPLSVDPPAPRVVTVPRLEPPREESDASHGLYPLPYADRPITHRQGTLVPSIGHGFGFPTDGADVATSLNVGFEAGLMNFIQVNVSPLRLALTPSVQYADPSLGLRFRFFPSPVFEMGFETNASFPVDGGNAAQSFFVPMRFHLAHIARIDLGARFTLLYDSSVDNAFMSLPFMFAFSLGPYAYAGIDATFFAATDAMDDGLLDFGVRVGGTVPYQDGRPLMDLELRVRPFGLDFVRAGLETGSSVEVDVRTVSLSLSATFYVHLVP